MIRGEPTTGCGEDAALALGDVSCAGKEGGEPARDSAGPARDTTASDEGGTAPVGDSAEQAEDGATPPAGRCMGLTEAGEASAGDGTAGEGVEPQAEATGGLGREAPSCEDGTLN